VARHGAPDDDLADDAYADDAYADEDELRPEAQP
jgi:hypothetical protein